MGIQTAYKPGLALVKQLTKLVVHVKLELQFSRLMAATPLVLTHFVINVSEKALKGSSSEYCFVLDIKSISTCRGLPASDKFRILSPFCFY